MNSRIGRGASFLIIAAIYILASVVGIVTYRLLPYPMWLSLLIADTAATVFTFIFSLIFRNASVYDPYWSVQPIVILAAFAVGQTLDLPRVLLLTAVCVWGVRLTANWAYTFHGLGHQDWRYTMLSEKTGVLYPIINFVGIHMVPTLVVYGCVLPGVIMLTEPVSLNAGCVAGFVFAIGAAVLQGSSDCQMHSFRRKGSGGFIRSGLWKYSRHPNYLGEIIMWWSVALMAVSSLGFRWYLISGAAANTLLFLCVSIPLADGRQSRKSGFAEYKRCTRMLLPIRK